MANTIYQSFLKFKSNLEITDLQADTVSIRHNRVRSVVDAGLEVKESFLTGSYSRSTMIAPLSQADIDIFVVLDTKYYSDEGHAFILDKVKATLKKTYTQTPRISRNGQAVTITFQDFSVDVVPAFYRRNGGFLIPNTITGSWVSTDPKKHISISSEQNKYHNGNLIPVVKMLKCWNKNINYYFSSFHIEVMAQQIFNNITISDFPSGVRFFLDKGREYVKKKNPDPAGYNDDVGSYLNTQEKLDQASSRFTTAYNRAIKAEAFAQNGKIEDAINEWIKIFGSQFPSF